MGKQPETASQTAGPYLHIGCDPLREGISTLDNQVTGNLRANLSGHPIVLEGVIFDGAAAIVTDALVELWQADADGVYHTGSAGFGRTSVDPTTGTFRFETVKPGPISWNDIPQAPHVALWIVARGINIGLHTRVYFGDDDHNDDPVLQLVPASRRQTLIAQADGDTYRLNIHLQGPNETVFFDV